MPTTTRHTLTYPVGTALAGDGNLSLQSLAEQIDEKLTVYKNAAGVLTQASDIIHYDINSPALSGSILIQTNIVAGGNNMIRLDVRGYTYATANNIIDLSINFYAYSDNGFYSVDVNNRGSHRVDSVTLLRRISDNKIAVAINTGTNLEHPKIVVDGYFGQSAITAAQLAGWTVTQTSTFTSYTTVITKSTWNNLTLLNGWVWWGGSHPVPRYRKENGIVYVQGVVKNGIADTHIAQLPVGLRPTGQLIFCCWTGDATQHRLDVFADGNIHATTPATSAVDMTFKFPYEQ